ncbi:MAG TPA: ArsR family transcriptional regulator [Acidimicrobiales bacterium]|jgi:DeoR family suf operon transcriptional repressor|nr:ArsR family transcriptional regulator [Acidimicrobiales bacterium]
MTQTAAGDRQPLESMPSTRRAILASLKRNGPRRSRDLVDELGITVTAVRQQLDRLRQDGLVIHRQEPEGRGRPAHIYELAPAAEEFFPKRYGDLTNELLGYLGGPDSDDVAELFEQRRQRRLQDARVRLADLSLDGKVRELTRILDEDGYLADVEDTEDGGWRIVEHNCAILSVATGFRQACTSEIRFISDALPEATVARVAHILSGAHVCAYEIRRRNP